MLQIVKKIIVMWKPDKPVLKQTSFLDASRITSLPLNFSSVWSSSGIYLMIQKACRSSYSSKYASRTSVNLKLFEIVAKDRISPSAEQWSLTRFSGYSLKDFNLESTISLTSGLSSISNLKSLMKLTRRRMATSEMNLFSLTISTKWVVISLGMTSITISAVSSLRVSFLVKKARDFLSKWMILSRGLIVLTSVSYSLVSSLKRWVFFSYGLVSPK